MFKFFRTVRTFEFFTRTTHRRITQSTCSVQFVDLWSLVTNALRNWWVI